MTDDPRRVTVRDGLVLSTLEEVLEKFKNDGLTPPEALMVSELLMWQLIDNLLKLAPAAALEGLRATAMRHALRIESRIKAWPARTENKH